MPQVKYETTRKHIYMGWHRSRRKCTIHAKHKGNIGPGLVSKIAKQELLFESVEELYIFMKN